MGSEILLKTAEFQGRTSILSFIWRHLYIIVLLIFTVPLLVSTINQAMQENNPAIPFLSLGLTILNADKTLYNFVDTLQTNPTEIIGIEKPSGIYLTFYYYISYFFKVIWYILGLLLLISLPFTIVYRILNLKNNSSTGSNILWSIIISLAFMFFMNLILTIHSLISSTLVMNPPDSTLFGELLWIIKQTVPFHGLYSLIVYIISLFL